MDKSLCVHKCMEGEHIIARHNIGDLVGCDEIEHKIVNRLATCPECDWAAGAPAPVYGTAESGLVFFAEFKNPVLRGKEDRVQHGTKLGLLRWSIYDGAINGLDVPNHWLAI
jgi:hypothetical protein